MFTIKIKLIQKFGWHLIQASKPALSCFTTFQNFRWGKLLVWHSNIIICDIKALKLSGVVATKAHCYRKNISVLFYIDACVWHEWCTTLECARFHNKRMEELFLKSTNFFFLLIMLKFSPFKRTWKGHTHSYGILRFDFYLGFHWEHMMCLLQH